MTLAEFKAWFDGYVENIDDMPTVEQWKRVKDRIGEIDRVPVVDYPSWPRGRLEGQRETIWPVVTDVSTGSVGSPEYVAEEDIN